MEALKKIVEEDIPWPFEEVIFTGPKRKLNIPNRLGELKTLEHYYNILAYIR